MSNNHELDWSTDLRRIAWWLQNGNINLAKTFIDKGKKLYPTGPIVGKRDWNWWMYEISQENIHKAAEYALTWSLLLNHTYTRVE